MTKSIPITQNIEAVRRQVLTGIHAHWKLFLFQGILMLFLGTLAVALPNISTLEIELLVGWLLIIGGIVRAATIFRKRHVPGFWWSLLSGIITMALGAMLIAHPLQGVMTPTLLMTVFFVIEGVAGVFIALEFRAYVRNWSWMVFGGLINLVFAYLIWNSWPNSATWVIGLYVGINMIFLGVPLIMTAFTARSIDSVTE
jgi:uncharacterized membrane protein HdeD (DUF308 family)